MAAFAQDTMKNDAIKEDDSQMTWIAMTTSGCTVRSVTRRRKDMLAGLQVEIHTERDRKLEAARQQRQSRRQQAAWRAKWPAARDVGWS